MNFPVFQNRCVVAEIGFGHIEVTESLINTGATFFGAVLKFFDSFE